MSIYRVSIMIFGVFFALPTEAMADWTWFYKKKFSSTEIPLRSEKNQLLFIKEDVPAFTQLVFSWNAVRPAQGYFSFFVSVRDAESMEWTPWLKMMDWGHDIQKSYLSEANGTTHMHVRLEMGKQHLADAFKLRIQVSKGAELSDLKAIAIALSNFEKFTGEDVDVFTLKLPSVYIPDVPLFSQRVLDHPRSDSLCSPTSCAMLTSFLLKNPLDPVAFAEKSYDTGLGVYGSWPFNMAHAFECCGGTMFFSVRRLSSFAALHEQLQKKIPVVVSVRGHLDGAAKEMPHGHLLVVVGYDSKQRRVLCHDPAFPSDSEVFKKYRLKSFLAAWERSHRLAYIAELF
jgi:hypothetical protein